MEFFRLEWETAEPLSFNGDRFLTPIKLSGKKAALPSRELWMGRRGIGIDPGLYLTTWNFSNLDTEDRPHYYKETDLGGGRLLREYWIVDLPGRRVRVHRSPTPDGFDEQFVAHDGERLQPLVGGPAVDVTELLGPVA